MNFTGKTAIVTGAGRGLGFNVKWLLETGEGEVARWEMTPSPVEFDMYYSY